MVSLISTLDEEDRFCIGCGYNLRALVSEQCPECGLPVNTADGAAIPWEGRKDLGIWRAFWRTAAEGVVHTQRLSRAVGRPVDGKSAVLFRGIVAVLTALPLFALFAAVVSENWGIPGLSAWQAHAPWMFSPSYPAAWEPMLLWSAGATIWPVWPIGMFIAAFLCASVPGWMIRGTGIPLQMRGRAVLASVYLFAPLILIAIPAAAGCVVIETWTLSGSFRHTISLFCLAVAFAGIILIGAVLIRNAGVMVSSITRRGGIINLMTSVVLPGWWLAAVVIGLAVFPMLVGLIWIMIDSLRP
jgi:hypothetical protein